MTTYPVLVVCGSPGSGKSTIARELMTRLGSALMRNVMWLRADSFRAMLFGEDTPYHPSQSNTVYEELLKAAKDARSVEVVILDGTFHSLSRARAVVDTFSLVPVWFIYLRTSKEKQAANLGRRGAVDVYDSQYTLEVHKKSTFEQRHFPLTCLCVDADRSFMEVLEDTWKHVAQIFGVVEKSCDACDDQAQQKPCGSSTK